MTYQEFRLVWWQKWIARGFRFEPQPHQIIDWPKIELPTVDTQRIAVFLPTMEGRLTTRTITRIVENYGARLMELHSECSDIVFYIAVQYFTHQLEQSAKMKAAKLATAFKKKFEEVGISVPVQAVHLRGPGKVISLNAMILRALQNHCGSVVLLDDDVELEPDCLRHLCSDFFGLEPPVAVGATKIGVPAKSIASRFLFWAKQHTKPATQYPHACCMMVSMDVLKHGIPEHLTSDDGFICFELLAPEASNPLARLPLVEAAQVRHLVGGENAEITTRIRRMLLNHYQFLCSYEPNKAHYYLRELLFFGFWPIGKWPKDETLGGTLLRWSVKFIYFLWFSWIGLELVIRSLVNRPITNIRWGTDNT